MAEETLAATQPLVEVHVAAADTARYAPSVHNTQPWRWRVLPERLELLADRDRQLTAADPEGRLLTISCGAALHHARLSLAAHGVLVRIVNVERASAPSEEAVRLVRCVPERRTDRRPVADQPVPRSGLEALIRAAAAERTGLQLLSRDQVLELASAAARAAATEGEEPQLIEELQYWTSRTGSTGLPSEVLPSRQPRTTVPARDFGRAGGLPVGPGHDRHAVYGLLFGDDDEPESWLRAGEGLSALWLTATRLGISVVPLSGVVEVIGTRETLRQMLGRLGHPFLALRFGIAEPVEGQPPRTPRLPANEVIDTSAVIG